MSPGLAEVFLGTELHPLEAATSCAAAAGTSAITLGICEDVQEQIKSLITDLMLSAPPRVRAQLSEALSIISTHDFPSKWPTLLPLLIEKLKAEDMQLVNGVLSTADSIYQRYR